MTKLNPTLSGSAKPLVPLPLIHSAASATAELVSCFILTPAEVLKQNAQMIRQPAAQDVSKGTLQTSASLEALRKFKKNPTQLWRGYTVSSSRIEARNGFMLIFLVKALAARNLPFTAMHFPMFEYLKTTIKEYKKRNGTFTGGTIETAMITAFSAGSAGSVAAVITTPIDVVKTRIMLSAAGESSEKEAVEKARQKGQTLERMARKQNSTRKGGINVAREVFLESGVKGLFRGSILRGTWTAVGSGLYLGVYESGKDWLGSRRENSQIE